MTPLDWTVIVVYLLAMIGMSVYLGQGQESQEDYYVGGRDLPWWAIGISTMATQSSVISFISIPAFVALQKNGGIRYLQYELAVPFAMIFIMVVFIPFFRKLELVSVYEYLEMRFSPAARTFLSAVFLVSRGVATGVALYAVSLVISVFLEISVVSTILLIGIVTLIYDTIGGMKAVVYSDVVQLFVMLFGIGACCWMALDMAGGWQACIQGLANDSAATSLGLESTDATDRLLGVDFEHNGLGDGQDTNFWALFFGGFFLYASYYGCDQSQTQRELSAPTLDDTKRSIFFNGYCRFPLVLTYVLMGIFVGGALAASTEFQGLMAEWVQKEKLDYMVPVFIYNFVPPGLRALIFASILAAAMSSLDSGLNSLSASTMRDFYERFVNPDADEATYLRNSKITTVCWGIFLIIAAMGVNKAGSNATVLELINKIGSAFYGPILAAFFLGVMTHRATGRGVIAGILVGVGFNLYLWVYHPGVSWWWWNMIGCLLTLGVGYVASLAEPAPDPEKLTGLVLSDSEEWKKEKDWIGRYAVLALYFFAMLAFCVGIGKLLV